MCPILSTLNFNKKILTWTWKHFSDQGQVLPLFLKFNVFEMGSMAENPILIDEMQYEKNFLLQQFQSLKKGHGVALKQKLGVSAITFKDIRVNISSFGHDCVYELKK